MPPADNRLDRLLQSISDAADLLNCCERTVRGLVERGDLDLVKLGKLSRIPTTSILGLIARRRRSKPASYVPGLKQFTGVDPPMAKRRRRRAVAAE
jgi:excisionase family DNA binding protein